jgi:hypothetical protein
MAVLIAVVATLLTGTPGAAADPQSVLPEGYLQHLIHDSGPAGPLAASHDGTVFMLYATSGGTSRIAQIDPAGGSFSLVYEVPPWSRAEWLVGGPGQSLFFVVDGALLHLAADGTTSTWSPGPLAGTPVAYSRGGRMIGISGDGTAVIELHPDGSLTTLLSGMTSVYDLVVASDGTIYISDFPAEELIELSPDGSSRVITAIAPDNTDLALDGDDNLYLNNAAVGFNLVDVATGSLTPVVAPAAPCRVIASPAVVVFDAGGRALFFSWVDHAVTWADPVTGQGGRVLEPTWSNTTAVDVGPDGALYVGVSGCGTASPATVRSVTADGSSSVRATGLIGSISGLAVTDSGGVFVAAGTETYAGLYYAPNGDSTLDLVPGVGPADIAALASFASGEEVLGVMTTGPGDVTLGRFSDQGWAAQYTVSVPEPVLEFTIDIAPDGAVYAQASEAANYFAGPVVQRWLLELDLEAGASEIVFQYDRQGCCPFDSFGVDYAGDLWWVLNPDFVLYQVGSDGTAVLFATNTPVDVGYANRNADNDIYLNAPEGTYRVWQATLSDRIALIAGIVDQLVTHDALSPGRGRALRALLDRAIDAADRGHPDVAGRLVDAFLGTLNRFVLAGLLDERPADYLISEVDRLLP